MGVHENRLRIGDPFVAGRGVEVGAGLLPILHPRISSLCFIDKRSAEEFVHYFGRAPEYDIKSWDDLAKSDPDGVDFISSHHVIEHISDPIHEIGNWLAHLKVGGVFYCSIPANSNVCEADRIETPIDHVVEDYLFQRGENSYESKQHIYSFVLQWSLADPPLRPWYARGDAEELASILLQEARRDAHDLHWHTYKLETIKQVLEAAFYFAGYGCDCLWESTELDENSHYLVFRKTAVKKMPSFLMRIKNALASASAAI